MGKVALPETVKMAFASVTFVSGINGAKFPVNLGPGEIMVLLSFFYNWYGTVAAGQNTVDMLLWRKTDTDPTSTFVIAREHSDAIWSLDEQVFFAAESVIASKAGHVILPWPMPLIRPPRLCITGGAFSVLNCNMRLYYLIQEVSDEDLAQLMVKDHA